KKVNLADVGVVGGLSDGFDDKAQSSWTGGSSQPSWNMGAGGSGQPSWNMGAGGSGLGMSGIPPSTQGGGIESLANYNKYQFGGFK
ncbi:hypothetical protein CFC21_035050, partial [Triticum aestivum]